MTVARMLILLACLAGGLAAQSRGGAPGWWENPLFGGRGLNLTDAQREQMQSTAREFRDRLRTARRAADDAEKALEEIFNEGATDERRANEAIERLAKTRGELTKVISQMTLKMRATLTAEQWQELQRMRPTGPPMMRPPQPGDPRSGKRRRGPTSGAQPPNTTAPKPAVL